MRRIENFHGQHGGAAKGCLIAFIIVLVLGGLGLYFGWQFITGVLDEQIEAAVKDDPVFLEQIGLPMEAKMNLTATAAWTEKEGKPGGGVEPMIFDVKGPKGEGRLLVMLDKNADEASGRVVKSAELRKDGKTWPMTIYGGDKPAPEKAPAETPEKAPEPAGAGAGDGK